MEIKVNIALSILSFILALFSLIFVIITLKQGQKQIEESRKQFFESKKLEYQPFLQMELVNDFSNYHFQYDITILLTDNALNSVYSVCRIKNTGNGTATNLMYSWSCEGIHGSGVFPVNSIMSGDEYCFQINLERDVTQNNIKFVILSWEYTDILGNKYKQKSVLQYNGNDLGYIESNSPKCLV